ncbi:MAG: prepilin-type N-terminal cleavage/methylation domain-containing protein [Lactobacillales bacterium]|nr:prepilin-type N-terminal cleavage/methylation domain-containing protein [Lactobacillales bacterium]
MKNKKGFTLIELLAVIVILAIIALIATPIILNMINDARKSAAVDSAYGYIEAIDYNNSMAQLNGKYEKIESGEVTSFNSKVNVKGTKPTSGTIEVDSSGRVIKATLVINGYEVKYEDGEAIVGSKVNDDENKEEPKEEPNEEEPEEVTYKCKKATELHTEKCKQEDTYWYCKVDGYELNSDITYGNLGKAGSLSSGDAFDCDVNGDKKYDSQTERFYYVTDLDNLTAVLVYSNNTTKGIADNLATNLIAYNENGKNYNGPVTAITNLPTTAQWKNVSLKNSKRQILSEVDGTSAGYGPYIYDLPTEYDYSGYAARFLTTQEIEKACSINLNGPVSTRIDNCKFLLENTKYSTEENGADGYWLETPVSTQYERSWIILANTTVDANRYANNKITAGVRPAIEVAKADMEI